MDQVFVGFSYKTNKICFCIRKVFKMFSYRTLRSKVKAFFLAVFYGAGHACFAFDNFAQFWLGFIDITKCITAFV